MSRSPEADRLFSVEQSLIAALLVFPDAIAEVLGSLYPSHFANRKLGLAFEAMKSLAGRGVAISPTSVAKHLRDHGHFKSDDGEQYFHDLWGSSGSAANVVWCADEIRAAWQARETAKACNDAMAALGDGAADRVAIVDSLQAKLSNIEKCGSPAGPKPMAEDLTSAYVQAREAAASGTSSRGISTGFPRLDWWTAGLQPSNLIVLAAQTGMGKTSLAMNSAAQVARNGDGVVVIFSMEMGRRELANRLAASEAGLDLRRLTDGQLNDGEWARLDQAQGELAKVGENILLDVSGRVTTASIRAHLRRIAITRKISLVIVDYLQLCGTAERAESQYVKTSMISGDLKAIAVDFDLPVLALSQLSREAARRTGEPRLSDLRDSGTIEQDANVVIFIHRSSREADDPDANIATVIVAKNRNGPTGKFKMHWDAKSVTFSELTDRQPPQRRA
jgi:replicative DNA helicase